MNFGLQGLADGYLALRRQHSGLVLATILATEGSTYRKPGARMLITPEGECHGLLGGEILHRFIRDAARTVFATRIMAVLEIGASSAGAVSLEQELEPGASVTVSLEYLDVDDRGNTMELYCLGLDRKPRVLVTVIESGIEELPPGRSVLIGMEPDDKPHDSDRPGYRHMLEICGQVRHNGRPALESCISGDGSFTAFYDLITPPLRLLLLGGGPDVIPVLRLALAMGWIVTIADPRTGLTQPDFLQQAHRVLTLEPEELSTVVDVDAMDAVVIMTHRLDLDERFLRTLRGNTRLRYIGLLGTRQRREKLLQSAGLNPDITGERIFGPIGLDLGGRAPEQIALALVSEIEAVMNNRSGGRLTGSRPQQQAQQVETQQPSVSEHDLYAVIMAAGGSSRFGGIKQLLELEGKSLLKRAIDTASSVLDNRVKLVLGIKPNKLQREADGYDIEVVINKEWGSGIASSLRAGIESLPSRCQGALIIFCDQPYINETHLRSLIDAWKHDHTRIVASAYADTVGVPVIFPRQHFSAIQVLKGDSGAKTIIENNMENVVRIAIPEAEIDIDTQEDLINILRK
jgi:xanthine/CO dehydrogenase XdhC/CoxF family maturation factor/CTP:molybdopterin cytidylyltransferase MocA